MKKVAYFGGFYWAEHSMWHSFRDAGVEIVYPFDTTSINQTDKQIYVPPENLRKWLEEYKPDIIVHRYYLNDPMMHGDVGYWARRMDIPYVVYRMETWPGLPESEVINRVECDLFMYANPCDDENLDTGGIPTDWWCWGVSSYERNLHIERTIPVMGFGTERHKIITRYHNLKMFVEGVWHHHRGKIAVPWPACHPDWNSIAYGLDFVGQFPVEEQTQKMNKCRIAVNFESIADIPGCYSHKMFQTMGCGTPTITYAKPEFEEMFEGALLQVETGLDVADRLELLDDEFSWNEYSRKSEEITHDKFDWFKNFDSIMKEYNIW